MSDVQQPGWAPKKPPPGGNGDAPPKPKRYWWRFTLASFMIVAVSAAATATAVLVYIDSVAEALSHNNVLGNKVDRYLSTVEGGEPQNILILGSDKRAGAEFEEDPGRSDTTILLRLDPEKNAIAVMSIPRDLKVEIPGVGTEKFNAAYTRGGPKLTLQVVKELTGLPINHVVNVDFLGFVRAVYTIGCVYTDVDRRYYHSNIGVAPSEQYAEINVQPGYQLLCGKKALQYVRYRHTDTDLVRSARQQDFISAARQRVSVEDLVEDIAFDGKGLIEVFTKYTTSDISDKEAMLQVLKLFLSVRNAPIKEVHFPANWAPATSPRRPKRSKKRSTSSSGSKPAAVRGARSKARKKNFPRRRRSAKGSGRRRSGPRNRRSRHPSHPAATVSSPRGKPASWRPRRRRAGFTAASRSSTRPGFPPAPITWKATASNTSSIPASTTSRTTRATGTPPTGWSSSPNSPTAPTTSGCRGFAAGTTRRSSRTRA